MKLKLLTMILLSLGAAAQARAADIQVEVSYYEPPGGDAFGGANGDYWDNRLRIDGSEVAAVLRCDNGKPFELTMSGEFASGHYPILEIASLNDPRQTVKEYLAQHGYSEVETFGYQGVLGTCVELRDANGALLLRKTLELKK